MFCDTSNIDTLRMLCQLNIQSWCRPRYVPSMTHNVIFFTTCSHLYTSYFFQYIMHVILKIVCVCPDSGVLVSYILLHFMCIPCIRRKSSSRIPAVLFLLICIIFCRYLNSTFWPLITLFFLIILCPWRFNYRLNVVDLYDHSVLPDLKSGGNTENMHSSVPVNAIMRWKDSQD